jgi:hypothetical protein
MIQKVHSIYCGLIVFYGCIDTIYCGILWLDMSNRTLICIIGR